MMLILGLNLLRFVKIRKSFGTINVFVVWLLMPLLHDDTYTGANWGSQEPLFKLAHKRYMEH